VDSGRDADWNLRGRPPAAAVRPPATLVGIRRDGQSDLPTPNDGTIRVFVDVAGPVFQEPREMSFVQRVFDQELLGLRSDGFALMRKQFGHQRAAQRIC
jgi:hypothetical protein